jgi:two-component system chemotaxis response regulator CheY
VDDVELNCELIRLILSKHFQCDTVTHGMKAIELFQEAWEKDQPYELICLDIMMPVIDGKRVLQILRLMEERMGEDCRPARIIMVSARFDHATMTQCRKMGCDAYIVKPIDPNEFFRWLKRLDLVEAGEPSA